MNGYAKLLEEKRSRTWHEAKALLGTATAEKRELTAAENTRYAALTGDLAGLRAAIDKVVADEKSVKESEEALRALANLPVEGRGHSSAEDQAIVQEFRAMLLERSTKPIQMRSTAPISHRQPGVERRDLLKTAPANFQPVSFYNQIIETMFETSAVLRAGATLVTTDTGEDLRIPRSTGIGSAGIVAEAAAIPESDPALGVVTLGAFKYGLLVQVSTEMIQDTSVDLIGYLSREIGTAIGLATGNHFISGSGVGQPRGVLADASLGIAGPNGTATSFGSQGTAGQGTDLPNNLWGSVAEPYSQQPGAAFLLRNTALTQLRNLKSTQGELVGTSFIKDSPAPFYVDPFVPALAASAKSVLFGDWSRYFVRMVNGMRFERSDDFAFDRDLVTFRCLLRLDGALIDPSGIKYFQNSAA